jgi:O-antigen/teichoic acid export membrane protein
MKIPFMQSDLIRKGGMILIATLLGSIVSFFGNIMIAGILGPTGSESFGNFKTIIYLFAFIPSLIDLGINASLIKYIAEFGKDRIGEAKHLMRWFLGLKLFSYVAMLAVILLFRESMAFYFLSDASLAYILVAGAVFFGLSFFSVFNSIMLGLQNFKLYSLAQFLSATTSVILAVFLSRFGMFYMLIGWGMGPLIGSIPSIAYMIRKRMFSDCIKTDCKRIFLRFSLPIYPVEFIMNLYTVIIPVLSLFFSQVLVSYYSFAFMFYYAAQLIPTSLSSVLFPKVSELHGRGDHGQARAILKRSFLYYGIVAAIGFTFVAFLSGWFLSVISPKFLPSLFMFQVILSLSFLFGFNVIYVNYLKGLGKVRKYALLSLAQNVLLIIASFILMNSQI